MYQRILVPIDGSETSRRALDSALGLAKAFGARLRLVHALDEAMYLMGADSVAAYSVDLAAIMREGGGRLLDTALAAAKAAGIEADVLLLDEPGKRLAESVSEAARQWGADLIVVGTHGRRGVGRALMGSGAEQIIRHAPVPVLAVRAAP